MASGQLRSRVLPSTGSAGRIALGTERTIEQDPAFALRILVDIAIRALSPAVNDPTTAVQVINHLEDTMALIGSTPGLDGRWEYRDDGDMLRLVMPAHRFDDLVGLAFTEIRDYGRTSIQVLRRLRAALVELESSVLPGIRRRDRVRAGTARAHGLGLVRRAPPMQPCPRSPTGRASAARPR